MKRMKVTAMSSLLTMLLTACGAGPVAADATPGSSDEELARSWKSYLEKTLAPRMQDGVNGGYALVIYKDGRPLVERADGFARMPWENQQPGVKMTIDTPVQLASVTKAVTAVAFLKAWELEGKPFSLDDPFWPSIKQTQHWVTQIHPEIKQKVTFRHLLTHQVGWGGFWDDWNSIRLSAVSQARKPMTREPGKRYSYDNSNFYWLRMLTEDLSGIEFNRFIDKTINQPLGITTLSGENPLPTLHYHNEGQRPGTTFVSNPPDNNWRVGADGAYASARDLARFLAGLRAGEILSESTLALMWPEDEDQERGLGWHIAYDGPEGRGWHHNGAWGDAQGQCRTAIVHFPTGEDAVLLCNNAMVDPLALLIEGYQYTRGVVPRENVVGVWREADLVQGKRATLRMDVSNQINHVGTYQVRFVHRFGPHGVDIHRVALREEGRVVSEDEHHGWAGGAPRQDTYRLHVDRVNQGAAYTLEVEIGGQAPQTNGDVELRYIEPDEFGSD